VVGGPGRFALCLFVLQRARYSVDMGSPECFLEGQPEPATESVFSPLTQTMQPFCIDGSI
jgi:hypothetical protein